MRLACDFTRGHLNLGLELCEAALCLDKLLRSEISDAIKRLAYCYCLQRACTHTHKPKRRLRETILLAEVDGLGFKLKNSAPPPFGNFWDTAKRAQRMSVDPRRSSTFQKALVCPPS